MNIKIIDEFSSQYNQKVIHPLQSWEWGEARTEMGIKVLRLGEYQGKELINVYQLTFHPIPCTNFKIGYLPRSSFPSTKVLEFLYDYGKKNNIVFIKIEPYEKYSVSGIQNTELLKTKNCELKIVSSSHPLFPEWTQIIDLTPDEEELLKRMHSKTRYNIRLAQKKGVVVKEMSNDEGFKIFSKLYFETCKRQQYFGHSEKYHQIVWNNLKKNIAHILIAFFNNTPLAVYELFYFKKILYYPYGGSSVEYKNVMAPNLLMWEAIRLGKKLGAEQFDFWGSLAPEYDSSHSWSGFTRFKQGYGGKFVHFTGSYDLIITLPYYRIYNFVYNLRQKYLFIKRRL